MCKDVPFWNVVSRKTLKETRPLITCRNAMPSMVQWHTLISWHLSVASIFTHKTFSHLPRFNSKTLPNEQSYRIYILQESNQLGRTATIPLSQECYDDENNVEKEAIGHGSRISVPISNAVIYGLLIDWNLEEQNFSWKTCTLLQNLQQVSQLWLWWWTRVRQWRNCCSNCTKLHVKKDDLIDEVYWKFQMGEIISSVHTWFATPSSTRPLCTGIHTLVCTTVSCICGTSTAWLNHTCKECTGRYIPPLLMKQPQNTPSSSAKSEWGASRVGSWVIRW